MKNPDFDPKAAHRFFSAECFNRAWDLMDKPSRTPEEDEDMIRLNQASLWHWSQRQDCTNRNMSIGYWQASRIHAVLGQADRARRYGELCLQTSAGEEPFYEAYAYEALARAESSAGNQAKRDEYLAEARRLSDQISDAGSKKQLLADLDSIA